MRLTDVLGVLVIVLTLPIQSAVAASGSSYGRVKTIQFYEGHSGVLIAQEGMSDLGEYGRSDLYILDDQHQYFDKIYALLLSAHVAGLPLSITVENCVQGMSRIRHVWSTR